MKKFILIIVIIFILIQLTVPKESIRFRIIGNSNDNVDQELKMKIVKDLQSDLIHKSNNIDEERDYIKGKIPEWENKISKYTTDYSINYGNNYFPEKEYLGKTYKEGFYESILITLGKGEGNNFWCILFPPLCFTDEKVDVKYESFFKEVLSSIF